MNREDGEIRDGDVATYERCTDPACPRHRVGYEHAHLVEVKLGRDLLKRIDDEGRRRYGAPVDAHGWGLEAMSGDDYTGDEDLPENVEREFAAMIAEEEQQHPACPTCGHPVSRHVSTNIYACQECSGPCVTEAGWDTFYTGGKPWPGIRPEDR